MNNKMYYLLNVFKIYNLIQHKYFKTIEIICDHLFIRLLKAQKFNLSESKKKLFTSFDKIA